MADLQQLLRMLGIQSEPQGPGIGDFPLGPRTPTADINRRALFETRSALRQRFDPLPAAPPPVQQGLQAPGQIPQLPRGQGMMGRVSMPQERPPEDAPFWQGPNRQLGATWTPPEAPSAPQAIPAEDAWRQMADVQATPTYGPLRMGEAAPQRGLEPPNAREVLTDAYLQQRGPNYRFEGSYIGPRNGTPEQRGMKSSWQPVPQPPQSAYRRADPPAPTIEEGAWTAAMARVRSRDKGDPDPTGLRRARDLELGRLNEPPYVRRYSR